MYLPLMKFLLETLESSFQFFEVISRIFIIINIYVIFPCFALFCIISFSLWLKKKKKAGPKIEACGSPRETSNCVGIDSHNQLQAATSYKPLPNALLTSRKIIIGELLGSTILIEAFTKELKSAWEIFLLMNTHRWLWILAFSKDT